MRKREKEGREGEKKGKGCRQDAKDRKKRAPWGRKRWRINSYKGTRGVSPHPSSQVSHRTPTHPLYRQSTLGMRAPRLLQYSFGDAVPLRAEAQCRSL